MALAPLFMIDFDITANMCKHITHPVMHMAGAFIFLVIV